MSDINCLIERSFAEVAEGGDGVSSKKARVVRASRIVDRFIPKHRHNFIYRDCASLTFVVLPCTAKCGFRDADDTLAVSETVSPEIYL